MIIGSAWSKEKDGKKYLSCVMEIPFLGKINFTMFKIDDEKRKSPDSPHMSIVWSAPKKQQEKTENKPDESTPYDDSNIPF
jgi:uncharacterized protein (DUF736 family)